MAVLTYSEISDLALDRIQANVSTDAPFTAAQIARHLNDAYADVWEISGGSIKRVASATAWAVAQSADTTGKATGILTDINEVLHVWQTVTSGSTGGGSTDKELDRVDLSEIEWLRSNGTAFGGYAVPKVYAVTRLGTTTPADVNKHVLDYWPGVSGLYFPMHYVPQFTPIDSATVTTPDVNDVESRDIAYIAAVRMAQLIGRPELVPGLVMDISERNRHIVIRKDESKSSGDHDR